MRHLCDKHTYRILWSDEDKEYVGLCAEFPSMSWLSPTPETALRGIRFLYLVFCYLILNIASNRGRNFHDLLWR